MNGTLVERNCTHNITFQEIENISALNKVDISKKYSCLMSLSLPLFYADILAP